MLFSSSNNEDKPKDQTASTDGTNTKRKSQYQMELEKRYTKEKIEEVRRELS